MIEEAIRAIVREEFRKMHFPTKQEMKEGGVDIRGFDPTGEGSAYQPEPAPGSDAEHPPVGYRLAKVGEKREPGYIFFEISAWRPGFDNLVGDKISVGQKQACANPIPANDGDSRVAESVRDCGNCASYNGSVGAIN